MQTLTENEEYNELIKKTRKAERKKCEMLAIPTPKNWDSGCSRDFRDGWRAARAAYARSIRALEDE